jgi:hypothetical protein
MVSKKCEFARDGCCVIGLKCSYLDPYGNATSCCYLPNSRGRFTFKKFVSVGVNRVVLSPSKYVRGCNC